MVQKPEESLLYWSLPDNFCDSPGDHVLPLHPHSHAAQGQYKDQQKGKACGDGGKKSGTTKLFLAPSITIQLK